MPPSSEPIIENVNESVRHYEWVEHRTATIIFAFISGIFFVGGLLLLGYSLALGNLDNLEGVLSIIFFGAFISFIRKIVITANIQRRFFMQVARSFGLMYSNTVSYETVSGFLFSFGNNRKLREVFSGVHSGHEVRFYTYSFDTGSGKSRRTHYLRVFETECNTELPEIMVHSKTVTPGGMTWQPKGTRSLTLEGHFSKAFDVFVPIGMEIEALQVLEPHHMDMLMQQYGDMGFYCHGTKLYVFTDEDFPTTRADFTKLIALVDELYDALVPELHAVSGDVTALREAFRGAIN